MIASLLLHGLIALAVSGCVSAQSAEELANLELYWSYDRSPPVYPPPIASGTGDWSVAYGQATALVGQMTNEEKQNVTRGYYGAPNGCSGLSHSKELYEDDLMLS